MGINAFAAGHNPANAAIGVTRGTLTTLNRTELQGVIAHEFSHILNGDMRPNIRLMGLLFGLLAIAIIGRTVVRFTSRRSRFQEGGVAVAAGGLAVVVIGYVGLFFGRLIQAAVSRSREVAGGRVGRPVHSRSHRPAGRVGENRRAVLRLQDQQS